MLDLQRLIDAAAHADRLSSEKGKTFSLRLRITGVEICVAREAPTLDADVTINKSESYRVVGYRSVEQAPVNPLITTLNDMAREVANGRN